MNTYDLVVIGGGINGVGIAADAAGRGLSVLLCEQFDLACATSSSSSKLIHGGLRYLEHYDFALVKESLHERKVLTQIAPHLVHPTRFIVPIKHRTRPLWLIRLGLFIYDLFGHNEQFSRSSAIRFHSEDKQNPLQHSIKHGFSYSDCTTDDARLVIANALRAKKHGAHILVQTECLQASRDSSYWKISLKNTVTQQIQIVHSKALVNASGPWADKFIKTSLNIKSDYRLQLVKGSHILVPKLYEQNQAYLLQHEDKRVIFVVPYQKQFTMIGTTDIHYQDDPLQAHISKEEIEYLCSITNTYFNQVIQPDQVVHTWSGVRALVNSNNANAQEIKRGYQLELNTSEKGDLPLINVFSGKLTTYRKLAEKAVSLLAPFFKHCKNSWTAYAPLPGGDLLQSNVILYHQKLCQRYPWFNPSVLERLVHQYGSLTDFILHDVTSISDLGQEFGHGLFEKELIYLVQHEWARHCEDVLWRRTKLGLHFSEPQKKHLALWMEKNVSVLIRDNVTLSVA